ncbi:mannosyl-oligosaccharide glucosidase GCS1 isoform X2 [Spinacia oleracea]|nr:mannosyl-oligosaccharide glucosidase GCS1-like isoform X2 [Spinacia oleracea]XP_056684499.1 mannosyl-oligosaccharide glucosidase GCS1-like isoform X2 [Spinacia oleracea]
MVVGSTNLTVISSLAKHMVADNSESHYAGFKTPHIHNLFDLVQVTLARQDQHDGLDQIENDDLVDIENHADVRETS